MRVAVRRQAFRLTRPFETSYATLRERETLLVTITDENDVTGHGEAAPLEPYDGVAIEQAQDALARYCEVLAAADPLEMEPAGIASLLDRCRRARELPQALAAVDVALWEIAARRAGVPLAELLSPALAPAAEVPVNATIAALDRAGAAAQAAQAAAQGFACVKLKVGAGDDAGRVAAVRAAAGPQMDLRLDANGAWSVDEAVRTIEALAPAGLELVEEPVHGLAALRAVREAVPARIAIDESAQEPGALEAGVADAVCLKLTRCGGITALLERAQQARASGLEVYVGSTLEGPLAIAASLHAAAALAASGPMPPCGLATLALLEGCEKVLPVQRGAIAVPQTPGLGVSAR